MKKDKLISTGKSNVFHRKRINAKRFFIGCSGNVLIDLSSEPQFDDVGQIAIFVLIGKEGVYFVQESLHNYCIRYTLKIVNTGHGVVLVFAWIY